MDLPVWQALYEELRDRNFVVITVAMDTGGADDVRQWIDAAQPTHPSLIDTAHVVAELYDWVNVPSNAWIDDRAASSAQTTRDSPVSTSAA
jgi:alkyl hydroperoxide reductase subunit AhpC